jgi:ATP-dependent Clp protease ATP-binding subunit ClpA
MKAQLSEALRLQFRPEFLNRIDEVIVFHALSDAELAAIVELLVADLARRLATQDLEIELTPAARALIMREGHDPAFGARPLKRTIQRLVENPLARALLQGQFKPGDRIVADADPVSGTLVFTSGDASLAVDAGERRDARAAPAAARRSGKTSVLDLPDTEPPRERDGGELVN